MVTELNDSRLDAPKYLETRVDPQIGWYDLKAAKAKRYFLIIGLVELGAAVTIPVLAAFTSVNWVPLAIAILGGLVAIAAGTTALFGLQENWADYRTTCESLKHEKYLFLTEVEPYDGDDPFPLFVTRVESLISKENSAWSQHVRANRRVPNQPTARQ